MSIAFNRPALVSIVRIGVNQTTGSIPVFSLFPFPFFSSFYLGIHSNGKTTAGVPRSSRASCLLGQNRSKVAVWYE